MGKLKNNLKYKLIKQHRLTQYLYCLNNLIDGKDTPEHVAMRAKKLKLIKENK